jgi:acyl dehydratase
VTAPSHADVDVVVLESVTELEQRVGTTLGHSPWWEIGQARIDQFAEATGDFQWIHVDAERAAQGPFGTTIAHGYLTLSLVPLLSSQIYRVEGAAMGVNYGSDKVRFTAPVPVGSRVRGRAELLEVTRLEDGCRTVVRMVVELEGSERPACVAEVVTIWRGLAS